MATASSSGTYGGLETIRSAVSADPFEQVAVAELNAVGDTVAGGVAPRDLRGPPPRRSTAVTRTSGSSCAIATARQPLPVPTSMTWRHGMLAGEGQRFLDDEFGFRPGDEHVAGDLEVEPPELADADDLRDRLACRASRDRAVRTCRRSRRARDRGRASSSAARSQPEHMPGEHLGVERGVAPDADRRPRAAPARRRGARRPTPSGGGLGRRRFLELFGGEVGDGCVDQLAEIAVERRVSWCIVWPMR